MNRLENKKVIITGGFHGIGKSIVEKCLQEGGVVATTYNSSANQAQELKKELKEYADRLFVYQMDVRNPEQVDLIMEHMMEQLSGIDVLVNNAGITKDSLFFMMKNEDWDDVIKTNLYGTFYTTKSAVINMVRKKKGSIVNISSVSGVIGVAGQSNYCASKFGIIGLTKSLAKELAYKNIRINAVAPGYIETDMVAKLGDQVNDLVKKKGTLGRLGTPEEIADTVVFLACDEASYITGQVLVADGGII